MAISVTINTCLVHNLLLLRNTGNLLPVPPALALEVSADELLGINAPKKDHKVPSLKLQKRMLQIEQLPIHQQKIILRTIDTFLGALQK